MEVLRQIDWKYIHILTNKQAMIVVCAEIKNTIYFRNLLKNYLTWISFFWMHLWIIAIEVSWWHWEEKSYFDSGNRILLANLKYGGLCRLQRKPSNIYYQSQSVSSTSEQKH